MKNQHQYQSPEKNMHTDVLIAQLSQQAAAIKIQPLAKPRAFILKNALILIVYALLLQLLLGIRPDLMIKLTEPFFALEIFLLLALCSTSLCAAIFNMYPDRYQNQSLTKLAYVFLVAFAGLMLFQYLMFDKIIHPPKEAILLESTHTFECLLCIFSSAALPFLILGYALKKGATVHARPMALMLALTSFGIAALSLRLAEVINDVTHLMLWHYAPALFASLLIAFCGRFLFKWY